MGPKVYTIILISLVCLILISRGERTLFDFSVFDIEGNKASLEQYKGKVVLVVNVASECGFTDNHYKGLVKMQKLLESTEKFTVLGFPCNQFGAQEPKGESEIVKFAKDYYGLNFPLFSKVNVIEKDIPAVWQFLVEKSGKAPNWNFWKYLVSHDGHVLNSWGPWTDVEAIFNDVKEAVDKAVAIHTNQIKIEEVQLDGNNVIEEVPVKLEKHDEM